MHRLVHGCGSEGIASRMIKCGSFMQLATKYWHLATGDVPSGITTSGHAGGCWDIY